MLKNGFSLVELMIVLVMIGIVAAIVIPKSTDASHEAAEAALAKDLRMVREQIELFRLQHEGILPGQTGIDLVEQLTGKTDVDGSVAADGVCGPYMRVFPANPFQGNDTVRTAAGGGPGSGDQAWYYNTSTGLFSPNDDAHKDM